jgi:hypothetical protein
MAFEAMFQPIQIGKLTIRNRVISTAHAEVYATDGGMTTERYVKYYEEKAKGGIGLAICGGSSVVAIDSPQEWWSSVNLATEPPARPSSRKRSGASSATTLRPHAAPRKAAWMASSCPPCTST